MPFLVKMRGQPSSYKQRFSIYGILPFWDYFGPKNGASTEIQTVDFFFDNNQYPNNVKKTYLTFIAICSGFG